MVKDDYAKWMLDDPRVNFAISMRGAKTGLDHLGIQAENGAELEDIGSRLAQADVSTTPQKGASCCYAKSDKYWTLDPQGVAWESFHSIDSVPVYGQEVRPQGNEAKAACCARGTRPSSFLRVRAAAMAACSRSRRAPSCSPS